MVHTKIYPEKKLIPKYCTLNRLQLLVIYSMMDIKEDSPQYSTIFSIENLKAFLLTQKHRLLLKINKWLMNNTSPSVEDLRNAKYFFSRAKIWYTDLADIQLIIKYNMEVRFFLCVIDICSKYSWMSF